MHYKIQWNPCIMDDFQCIYEHILVSSSLFFPEFMDLRDSVVILGLACK